MTEHTISVVIPIYSPETSLELLLGELNEYRETRFSRNGMPYRVDEVILVIDSDIQEVNGFLKEIQLMYSFVRVIWLSRNFGQHAATIAGMSSSTSDWIVSMDEDGEHNPIYISDLLDEAISSKSQLVYGVPTNASSHGVLRDIASKLTKNIASTLLGISYAKNFQSYRIVLGSMGRSVSAFSGVGVYLDVALSWIIRKSSTVPVELRRSQNLKSSYTTIKLLSHFARLLVSSGTRILRFITYTGISLSVLGIVGVILIAYARLFQDKVPQGWASLAVIEIFASGLLLSFVGLIAEYVGLIATAAIGKPLFLIVDDPNSGPMYRNDSDTKSNE